MSERQIRLGSAIGRLQDALDLLNACKGIATDDGAPATVEEFSQQVHAPAPIDRPLADYMVGMPLEPGHVGHRMPAHWTVRQAIERAADEARHGAQEALDEIAHAQGWPR